MKKLLVLLILLGVAAYFFVSYQKKNNEETPVTEENQMMDEAGVVVTPVSHATAVFMLGEATFYTDPVGGAETFSGFKSPDVILVTDIHGDHLNVETLEAVVTPATFLITPQAVSDQLSESLARNNIILANGEDIALGDFRIEAIPMYNLREEDADRHIKGRGNGYVVEKGGTRVYVAGDTEDIPEMRALKDIDIAFIPMNLPYTMSVEQAADAVLEFKPHTVYPYHYRTPDGFSDVEKFKELVNAGNPDIEVVLLDWYQE